MASTYLQPPSNRRRAVSVGLTILVHLALLWMLLHLNARDYVPMADSGALSTFTATPDAPPQPRRAQRQPKRQQPRAAPAPHQPTPPPPPIVFKDTSGVIWLTKDQFAKSDIAKTGSLPPRAGAGDALAAAGGGESDKPVLVQGGRSFYAAEWYRRPTDAELSPFMPSGVPVGSAGAIGCRMVPDYRVEDCEALGDDPPGTGLATAMRRAAWQFRVRPPRINGKPSYGTWVRIVIEITPRGASAQR